MVLVEVNEVHVACEATWTNIMEIALSFGVPPKETIATHSRAPVRAK